MAMARKRSDTWVQGTKRRRGANLFRGLQYVVITGTNWVKLDK